MILALSSARELAVESIARAQRKYKALYDRKVVPASYQVGDWVLVKFPQEESGRCRKLSRPWHGPYRVVTRSDPDVTVTKVYHPQEGNIQVHQSRVNPCPPGFPAGYYWYGARRHSPGRPPKWIKQLLEEAPTPECIQEDCVDADPVDSLVDPESEHCRPEGDTASHTEDPLSEEESDHDQAVEDILPLAESDVTVQTAAPPTLDAVPVKTRHYPLRRRMPPVRY